MSEERLLETISSIYEASLVPDRWDDALARAISLVGRDKGCLQFINYQSGEHEVLSHVGMNAEIFANPPEISVADYDIWAQHLDPHDNREIVIGSQLVDAKTYRNSVFYNEIAKPYDNPIHDALTGIIGSASAMCGMAVIYGNDTDEFFGEEEIQTYEKIWPHFVKAFQIQSAFSSISTEAGLTAEALDRVNYAIFGLDASGHVILKNRQADAMLAHSDAIVRSGSGIGCHWPDGNRLMQAAIFKARQTASGRASGGASAFTILPGSMDRKWTVTVAPVCNQSGIMDALFRPSLPSVLVSVSDHQPAAVLQTRTAAAAFELTGVEEKLLLAISSGKTMKAFAEETGRSVETLRSQLKSIYRKTGTNSQVELARMILTTPAL
jgi:DNA-binding CsgD family transcriptional regulator